MASIFFLFVVERDRSFNEDLSVSTTLFYQWPDEAAFCKATTSQTGSDINGFYSRFIEALMM